VWLGINDSDVVVQPIHKSGSYLLFTNPERLQSETYNISKLAIERSIQGDSIAGLTDPRESGPRLVTSGKGLPAIAKEESRLFRRK
jgi:hypothetical protein